MSRHQLTLLAGWVLHCRVKDTAAKNRTSSATELDYASRPARFLLVDSSPQDGSPQGGERSVHVQTSNP